MPERVIRRARLRDELRPIPISAGVPPRPINAEWAAIVHTQDFGRESFNLGFYSAEGRPLEWLQFETLQIGFDQAAAIAGIEPSEWETCDLALPRDRPYEWCQATAAGWDAQRAVMGLRLVLSAARDRVGGLFGRRPPG